jgi:hypothetical protein
MTPLEIGTANDAALAPSARQTQRKQADALVGAPAGVDGLTALALAYLAFPNLIFLFGWFRLPIALLLCSAMIYFIARVFRPWPAVWRSQHAWSAVVLLIVTSCAWAAFGGGSHFMYANADWKIRDAVLGDLVNAEWPVHYLSADGAPLILRSAIGYFLPPALFGKIFGLAHMDLAVYAWTTLGVLIFLLMLPLPRRAGWRLALGLLLVVSFGGMDFLGQVITTGSMPIFPLRLEWWVPLSYSSLTGQLLWAPNHCLPIWIATLLYFRHRKGSELLPVATAALPLTLIWTPFAAIGLLPFAMIGTANYLQRFGWPSVPWNTIVAAAAFSLPVVLFLLIDAGQIASALVTVASPPMANVAWQPLSLRAYLLFVSCEFLFLALVLAPHLRHARAEFWVAVLVLLGLPLIRFGPSNDFGLRLSAPALLIMLAACLAALLEKGRLSSRSSLWMACLFLAVGAHTAFNELWRAATFNRSPPDYQRTLADRQGGQPATHYVGRLGSTPLQHFLRTPSRKPQ